MVPFPEEIHALFLVELPNNFEFPKILFHKILYGFISLDDKA
jgi:hypothetical protein